MEYHHELEWLRYTVLNWVTRQSHVADGRNVNNSWDNSSVNDSVHTEFRYFLFLSYFGLLSRIKIYYTVLIRMCCISVYVIIFNLCVWNVNKN